MPDALSVSLIFGGTTYDLQAETIEHSFTRAVNPIALPGNADKTTNVFTIDLGINIEEFSVRGVVNKTSTGGNDPSKANLETAAKTWWDLGSTAADLPKLKIFSDQYYGHIKNISFQQDGSLEDRWLFNLSFLVRQKV